MSNNFLEKFRRAVEKVARENGTHPREVTRTAFIDAETGISKNQIFKRYGAFSSAINKAFPPDDSPFKHAENLQGHELSRFIANVMEDCASDLGMPPHELQWHQFRKWINFRFGENDKGIAKSSITLAGGFPSIRDAWFPMKATKAIVEKQRLVDQANMNRRLGRAVADEKFILDQIENYCKNIFTKVFNVQVCCKATAKNSATKRIVTVVISDNHIGSDLNAEETGALNFGRVEEARRLAHICKSVCEYKLDHRNETKLVILLLGDLIQGDLRHGDERGDGAVLAEQIARAIHLYVQAISYMAAHFTEVDVHVISGNHDRTPSRHKKRAVNQKWDSLAFIIGTSLKYALAANCKNVKLFMPRTPYLTYEVFGKKIFATHGDTVFQPGYPGQNINVGQLENQLNRLNASLPDKQEYSAVVVGHVHTGNVTYLGNGSVFISNGALIPVDQYSIAIGIPESSCGQMMWESVPDHPVGDIRFIKVGKAQDEDENLDEIITPWEP